MREPAWAGRFPVAGAASTFTKCSGLHGRRKSSYVHVGRYGGLSRTTPWASVWPLPDGSTRSLQPLRWSPAAPWWWSIPCACASSPSRCRAKRPRGTGPWVPARLRHRLDSSDLSPRTPQRGACCRDRLGEEECSKVEPKLASGMLICHYALRRLPLTHLPTTPPTSPARKAKREWPPRLRFAFIAR